jgi:DnaJ-class molecular chaperone
MTRILARVIAFATCAWCGGTGNLNGTGYCAGCNGSGSV